MPITEQAIDDFVTEQVQSGASPSRERAESEMLARLWKNDLDRKIARGKKDASEGRYTKLTDQSIDQIAQRVAQKVTKK